MVKRVLALLLVTILAASMLTGCGAKPSVTPIPQARAKKKIGLVFGSGARGDHSFNDSAYAGLEKAQKDFADKIEIKCLEPGESGETREELLRLLAGGKYDLIFGVGFMLTDQVADLAKEFPDVKFALIDGFLPDLKKESNVTCISFMEHEGSFLMGATAALASKTNRVGFVGGMKIPLIERFEAGFHAGAKTVNPRVTVFVDYMGVTEDGLENSASSKDLALKQYAWGADVVYHASDAGGPGVFEAAASRSKFAIGVNSDQALTAKPDQQPLILTSMIKRVDVAVYDTVKALLIGKYAGGYRVFGLADGGIDYASDEYNATFIKEFGPRLEEYKAKIAKGEIVVPDNNEELRTYLANLGR